MALLGMVKGMPRVANNKVLTYCFTKAPVYSIAILTADWTSQTFRQEAYIHCSAKAIKSAYQYHIANYIYIGEIDLQGSLKAFISKV